MRHRRSPLLALLCGLAAAMGSVVGLGLSSGSAAAFTGSVLPAYGGAQPRPSLFGLNTGTFDTVPIHFKESFGDAKRLGARWLHFTDGSIHWDGDHINYATMDYEVAQARKRHMGVMISLGGAPYACSTSVPAQQLQDCPPTTAANLRDYQRFVRGILLRYRNDVTYYESWVAPNHNSHWLPGANPAQYARLLQTQYSVFRSVNKQFHLNLKLLFAGPADFSVGPGSPNGYAVLPFTDQVLGDLHGQRDFDGVALRPYEFPPSHTPSTKVWVNVDHIAYAAAASGPFPQEGCVGRGPSITWCQMDWPQELRSYEQEFSYHGYRSEPIWLAEWGWPGNPSVPPNPQPSADYYPSYAAQARDLGRAYKVLLKLPFMQAAFWFNMRDYRPGISNPDPQFFAHYGLLNYNRSPKPAASVFSELANAHPNH